jgi:hypothetical protein
MSRRYPVRKTTQQRKADSVARDRRSTYGETSKAARKSVARNKRHRSRAERRLAHASFGPTMVEDEDAESLAAARVLRKHRVVAQPPAGVPPGLVERVTIAKGDMMAYASKKLRQLLARMRG